MEPLVSIIVPVYNVRRYLREALDSVINQTYKNLEIIVIDDGSTDGSGRICDLYAKRDSRIKVIHQENKGLSAARNAGLDIMTGEYVGFLDSDDAFEPEMVETMVRRMVENDAEVAACGYTVHETEGRLHASPEMKGEGWKYNRGEVVTSVRAMNMWLTDRISQVCWDKLWRCSLWSDIRFPNGHVYEDTNILLRVLSRADRILLLDRILVKYRKRAGSITQTRTINHFRDYLLAMQEVEAFTIANTPGIFSVKTRDRLLDIQLRRMLAKYSELILLESGKPYRQDKKIRAYLLKKGRRRKKYRSIKTYIVWILFKRCPYMIPLMRSIYIRMLSVLRVK